MNGSNKNSTTVPVDSELSLNYWALFLLCIPTATISGNCLVVTSVVRVKSLRTGTNVLICSLATADFLVATIVMPFAVYVELMKGKWFLPVWLCDVYMAADVWASTASILNLLAISVDRYIAVMKPMSYSRRISRRVISTVAAVWICSFSIALPLICGVNRISYTDRRCVFTNANYIIYSSIGSFYIPCIFIIIVYGIVIRRLRKRHRFLKGKSKRNPYANVCSGAALYKEDTKSVADIDKCALPLTNIVTEYGAVAAQKKSLEWSAKSTTSTVEFTGDYPNIPALIQNYSLSVSQDSLCDVGAVVHSNAGTTLNPVCSCRKGSLTFVPNSNGLKSYTNEGWTAATRPLSRSLTMITPKESVNNSPSQLEALDSTLTLNNNCHNIIQRHNGAIHWNRRPKLPFQRFVWSKAPLLNVLLPRLSRIRRGRKAMVQRMASIQKYSLLSIHAVATGTDGITLREHRKEQKERKATQTLAIVVGVFLVCFVPFFSCHLVNSVCLKLTAKACVGFIPFFITTWCGYMNSFMNPIIYTLFNPEFRTAFRRITIVRK